jgi:dephospho-CoA kinase
MTLQQGTKSKVPSVLITGPAGSGKTSFLRDVLAQFGPSGSVCIISADEIGRDLLKVPNYASYLSRMFRAHNHEITVDGNDEVIDTKKLLKAIMQNEQLNDEFMNWQKPSVLERWKHERDLLLESSSPPSLIIFECAIYLSYGNYSEFDRIVAFWVDEKIQRERLKKRTGYDDGLVDRMISHQTPKSVLERCADYPLIDTSNFGEGSVEYDLEVTSLVAKLKGLVNI